MRLKRSPGGTPYFTVPFLWAGGVPCWFFILIHRRHRRDPDAMERLLTHEDVHIGQQKGWKFPLWLAKYLLSDRFRLSQEAPAYATNVCWYVRNGYPRQAAIMHHAKVLYAPLYRLRNTFSLVDVYDAIELEVTKL